MRPTNRLSLGLSAAVAVVLSTMGTAANFAARQVKEINFTTARDMPTGYPFPVSRRKPSKSYPFSSDRQHRRNARSQITLKGPNGHPTMQTLPSFLRRNDIEVDRRLGRGK